ncbi:MAG: hypothetical protein JXR96_00370 [Deltaproteobacteria bacterium]|nr:hypothetical protein [Deltaproteobacteria bacterium]
MKTRAAFWLVVLVSAGIASCDDESTGCATDSDCAGMGADWICDRSTGTCMCEPDCAGRCCGDDGCGGTCPDGCEEGRVCNTGSCICEVPGGCTHGEMRCDGDVVQICSGGEWDDVIDCAASGQSCQEGACVAGSGGIGDLCTDAAECASGICMLNDEEGFCTQECDCVTGGCPVGECILSGGGKCWCGFACPGGAASECPNGGTGWGCVDGICLPGACVPDCDERECGDDGCGGSCGTCDPDYWCDEDGQCLPEGSGSLGDPCPYNGANATADDCQRGLYCTGFETGGECSQDPDCTGGFFPAANPDCVDGQCAVSFCTQDCDSSGLCPSWSFPFGYGDFCICVPQTPGGTSGPGEPCPLGGVNVEARSCQSGLMCWATAPEEYPCSRDSDCDQQLPASWNPDCVDGWCGTSFCSEPCDSTGSCPSGFEPWTDMGICYCLPL